MTESEFERCWKDAGTQDQKYRCGDFLVQKLSATQQNATPPQQHKPDTPKYAAFMYRFKRCTCRGCDCEMGNCPGRSRRGCPVHD